MRSTTVDATDDYLRWASSHCTRTSATAEGNLPCAPIRPNPNRHSTTRGGHTWVRAQSGSHRRNVSALPVTEPLLKPPDTLSIGSAGSPGLPRDEVKSLACIPG